MATKILAMAKGYFRVFYEQIIKLLKITNLKKLRGCQLTDFVLIKANLIGT